MEGKKKIKIFSNKNVNAKFNYLSFSKKEENVLVQNIVYFKRFRFNFFKKCVNSFFTKKVETSLSQKKKFLKKIQIKVVQNNIFFTFTDLIKKKVVQIGSSGIYKIKISKRKLKYFYKNLIFIFFKKLKRYINNLNNTQFTIISPIKLRKKICKIIIKKIKYFNKKSSANITLNIVPKKCFNGCRVKKQIKKKRRLYRIFK